MLMAFAYGPTDLLVRAAPSEQLKTAAGKAARFDPSLRNGYHVNGKGYLPAQDADRRIARIVKSWRGPDWAAAKCLEAAYDGAAIARTVLHLKAHHALVIVDELAADAEAEFEQFWQIATGLAPSSVETGSPYRFAAEADGGLTVAFDPQRPAAVVLETVGPNPCLRRREHLARGVTAALFQWTANPAPAVLGMVRDELENWSVTASGAGFDLQISLSGGELRSEPLSAA